MSFNQLKVWLLVALLSSTALFVVGIALERSVTSESTDVHTETSSDSREHAENGESAGSEVSIEASSHSDAEAVLGIDIESPWLVAVAVVLSLGLAALAWWRPSLAVLVALVALGLAFAAVDVIEVVHQASESRAGLATLAAVVAALHLAVAATAGVMARMRPMTA